LKWFKHDADASNDAKLRKLRLKYGATGYGIYWYCLELIARNVEKHNLTFELEHDAILIGDDFKLSGDFVQEMMAYMVDLGLFENSDGVVTCLKMLTRTDEYTQKLIKELKNTPDTVPTISEETPRKSVLIEEKRREEKDIPKSKNKISIPENFSISESVLLWAEKNNHSHIDTHFNNFVLVAKANGYKYADWDSAFMRAVRDNWANVQMPKKRELAL
jgi:hypothetical protein